MLFEFFKQIKLRPAPNTFDSYVISSNVHNPIAHQFLQVVNFKIVNLLSLSLFFVGFIIYSIANTF